MTPRRLQFVIALVVLLAIGILTGNASARTKPAPASSAANTLDMSGVLFCPGLPPALQRTTGQVTFANVGTTPADIEVTDLPDAGRATTATFSVGAASIVTKSRAEIGPPGALTVESFGGQVVVEEWVEGATGAGAGAPCAPATQTRQLFAAGTTLRGVQQWLVIQNPYASDARINVTLQTSNGIEQPDSLQGLDVSRRSRLVIAIDAAAIRDPRVAVEVDADAGSVVATQTLVFTPQAGTAGVAMTLGAAAPNDHWIFPGNIVLAHTTTWVAVSNTGITDALVDVQAATDAKHPIAPAALTVPADQVAWVQIGHCGSKAGNTCVGVPDGASYELSAASEQRANIVAQVLTRGTDGRPPVGADTTMGAVSPARHFAFAHSRVTAERTTTVSMFNPGAAPATVSVALRHDGANDRYARFQGMVVAPGAHMTVILPTKVDAAIVVDASVPIYVVRAIGSTANVATSGGVVLG